MTLLQLLFWQVELTQLQSRKVTHCVTLCDWCCHLPEQQLQLSIATGVWEGDTIAIIVPEGKATANDVNAVKISGFFQ